ncbi:MAG TPA: UDP-N-acetylmuramoyl-L-alanine--D-glutamate ligase [Gammaproteobacteria bacterium]|nr:UDP-N-acetylmuramoyl-L-alanine--D-glutamate ligase [Gammaproteobacteria bacterium]
MAQARHKSLIVGLGDTGLAVARFLARRGDAVAVTDNREEPPCLARIKAELPDVAVFVGGYSEAALAQADRVVVSPGIAPQHEFVVRARALGLPVIGDIELFAAHARAPIVGISGTNGKSTVTTLVGLMAARAGRDVRVGGNLSPPALALLSDTEPDLYVLELSSFQLEMTEHLPLAAGAVLNIAPDHLDRHLNLDAYAAAKARLYYDAAISIVNRDDTRVMQMAAAKRRVVSFGLDAPAPRQYGVIAAADGDWLARGETRLMPVSDLKIRGRHNVANALAALALGAAAGLPDEAMLAALNAFGGLPHRMTLVAEHDGVAWYDDSKATNIGAALAAIAGTDAPVVVIVGGDGKGQNFDEFAAVLAARARAAVLIGRDAPLIGAALDERVPHAYAADMDAAVKLAAGFALRGDCVLLAPACASLDMYTNYAERGERFAVAVRRLAGG